MVIFLNLLQLVGCKSYNVYTSSQLLRWRIQHPHYNEIARMLTQCFNRFVDLANRHDEVFLARRDCTWLRGFLYYLIHRASCGFTIEQWVDWKSARDGLKKSGRHISHCQTASSCGLNRAAVGAGSPASLVVAGCPALPMAPKKASVARAQRHALSVLSFECSPGVLQSRRGAAKHQGCCKAPGVLQSTRGAAKHKGSTGGVLQSTKLLFLDLTGACTVSACTL